MSGGESVDGGAAGGGPAGGGAAGAGARTAPSAPAAGLVSAELAGEFPGLRLRHLTAPCRVGASPPALLRRLRSLSDRQRGAALVAQRTRPVAQAYRSFFRQIGLDPDVDRIPAERAAVRRLLDGGLRSSGMVADACLVAVVETGVGVWALDADVVHEPTLGISVGTGAAAAVAGALVVADERTGHALLFSDPLPGHGVTRATSRAVLYAIGVDGVPELHLEEALWCAAEAL